MMIRVGGCFFAVFSICFACACGSPGRMPADAGIDAAEDAEDGSFVPDGGTACTVEEQCPAGDNWACVAGYCACAPMGAVEVCGDGADNDCDGRPDGCLWCEGREFAPDDASHCGTCDVACPAGQPCLAGVCACPDGGELCLGACVDLSSDSRNCGGCEQVCRAGRSCEGGACVCSGSTMDCGGVCLDTATDPVNCGACGVRCPDGASCVFGVCACPGEQINCAGECIDIRSNPLQCGACGVRCPAGAACEAGVCGCPADQVTCGSDCADLSADTDHCGDCGTSCVLDASCVSGACVCPADEAACAAECADLSNDEAHCGACENVCPPTASCESGGCVCEVGSTVCGDVCADLLTAEPHCGACGQVCGGECIRGQCIDIVSVHPGDGFTCALMRSGEVWCWGGRTVGGRELRPVRVASLSDIVFLEVGYLAACAIDRHGALSCWGRVAAGTHRPEPQAVALSRPAVRVAVGEAHFCALLNDSSLWCWGAARLGDGMTLSSATPVAVAGASSWRDVSAGRGHTCALDLAGQAWCWGSNTRGQLGNGTTGGSVALPARVADDLPAVVQIETGLDHSCARTGGRSIYCWGDNVAGQSGRRGGIASGVPRNIGAGTSLFDDTWVGLAAMSGDFTCGRRFDDTALCWGRNSDGQIGDGGGTTRLSPTSVVGPGGVPLPGVTQVEAGRYHTCLLTNSSSLYCWGNNSSGELGDGTTVDRPLAGLVLF